MSIALEALLLRSPGAPKPPDEAIERLVSCGPDMGMEPEQEERERAVAVASAVEIAFKNNLSAGDEARLRKVFDLHGRFSARP